MSSTGSDDHTDRESLMSERDRLLKSIEWYFKLLLGPNEIARSLGKYLGCVDVPWLRMYEPFLDWQRQSGLLTDELHKDDVEETPVLVFCTLIKPRSRKDLGGRTWENKGAPKPKAGSQQFDMTKLYYPKNGTDMRKEDGFTVIEFVRKIHKPHVALCVLHRTDYRRVNRYLLDKSVGYGCAPPENLLMSASTSWQHYETSTMRGGLNHTSWQNSMIGPSYSFHMNDIMSFKPTSIGYPDAPAGNSMMTQENTCTMNDNPYAAMLPEPKAPADEMSMQNDPFFTSILNNLDHDPLFTWSWNDLRPIPSNQYATTGGNEPRQPDTTSALVNHLMGATPDYAPDEHFSNRLGDAIQLLRLITRHWNLLGASIKMDTSNFLNTVELLRKQDKMQGDLRPPTCRDAVRTSFKTEYGQEYDPWSTPS